MAAGPSRRFDRRGHDQQTRADHRRSCGRVGREVCGGADLLLVDDALLAGRAAAMARANRPPLVTALLWIALALFSSISLSSSIVSDRKLYGTIGVVFTLLTWFILVAAVVVLGAALGAVWQHRRGQSSRATDTGARPS